MKRTLAFLLALLMCLTLCACGEGKKATEAYELLEEAENLCKDISNDVYNAWYFGIYTAKHCSESIVFSEFSQEVSFSSSELKAAGYSAKYLVNGNKSTSAWQFCLWTVKDCLETRGDYGKVDSLLEQAREMIEDFSEDYEYSQDFKTYFTKIASYNEFLKELNCSFEQLAETTREYEKEITTSKENLKFDFYYSVSRDSDSSEDSQTSEASAGAVSSSTSKYY